MKNPTIITYILLFFFLVTACLPLVSRKSELDGLKAEKAYSLDVDIKEDETVYKIQVIAFCEISGEVEMNGKKIDSNTEKVTLHESDFYFNRFELEVVPVVSSTGRVKVKAKYYIQR
ncbi:hypothetical protein MM213_08185 [Belliella sp. R4-6]|uniref:Lipoprotein n=1 Tax=Belliella alkalica TaxID=1730871 RepID=A0ABS9VAK7_9BACT|nr:hypothetical protein [Belliella alkalica]MCH7413459.1 hypothetical protein [Belliella alkalica]